MTRPSLFLSLLAILPATAAPTGCVGSFAVANFRLTVAPPNGSATSYLNLRQVNNVAAGARIRYQPLELPPDLGKEPRVTLVMVPRGGDGQITVLEPRSLVAATEWSAPFAAQIVLLVFAPQGLDEKRLTNLVTRDQNLLAALADYADETADLEHGLEAINAIDDTTEEAFRPTTPTEQALFALVRALNPAVSSYNPLGAGRRTAAATLMGKGAEAFFENAGGLVPGGGVLPALKPLLMPDTEFRSVFARNLDTGPMALCAQLQARSRNKMAYLWAYRLASVPLPNAALARPIDSAIGTRATVPLKLDKAADWRLLERAYDWTLIGDAGPLKIPARAGEDLRALQLDLRKFAGAPGAYRVEAKWDWDTLRVPGTLRLHPLGDLAEARLTPESQDRLIAGTGPVDIELTGGGLLFVDKASLHRPGSARQIPLDLPTARGETLQVEVDTSALQPGLYYLALARESTTADVPIHVLPAPPKLSAVRVNAGEREQTVTFTGTALDRIAGVESDRAAIELKPATNDGTRREATIRLASGATAGELLALAVKVDGMSQAVRFPGLLQVAGARPRIREAKATIPRDLAVAARDGELPAGSWVSFSVVVEPAGIQPALNLQCAEAGRTVQAEVVRAGEKRPSAQWTSAGNSWFLSLDPGAIGQSGCTLQAALDAEGLGKSDPFPLGKVVRLPRIEGFALTDEKTAEGYAGSVRGFDLETIEKTGWTAQLGVAAPELPRPVAGEGSRQTLRIAVPWPSPSPKAPLYIWLRGESEGRATRVTQ